VTTRGMGPSEMEEIGAAIARVLQSGDDAAAASEVKRSVAELCAGFPLV